MKGDSVWTPRALKEVKGQISLHNLGALFKKEAKPKPFFHSNWSQVENLGVRFLHCPYTAGDLLLRLIYVTNFLLRTKKRLIHCGMGIEKGIMGGKKMPRVSCCAICRQLRRVARCVSPDIYNFLSLGIFHFFVDTRFSILLRSFQKSEIIRKVSQICICVWVRYNLIIQCVGRFDNRINFICYTRRYSIRF